MNKTSRIEFRTEPETKRMIETAASIQNLSVSTFIAKTLKEASEEIVGIRSATYLNNEQFEKLLEYLESDYEPSENLIKVAKRPSKFVVGDV